MPGKENLFIWPTEEISKYAKKSSNGHILEKNDIHLVFEYREGDTILQGRYTAPRSNRFYFVHDPNGGKMK